MPGCSWTTAYERAAIVWALSASAGQLVGISAGTTLRRYVSSGSSLITFTVVVAMIRRVPRYRSYEDGFDQSWRLVSLAIGRTRRSPENGALQRTVPPAPST